ncbi:MAG: hypothetical protein R3F60_27080 [bacterium]
MTPWIVDTGVLAILARHLHRSPAAWDHPTAAVAPIHVTEWVAFEARGKPAPGAPPSPESDGLLRRTELCTIHPIMVPSAAWDVVDRLTPHGSLNRGEAELIALAATTLPDGCFVTLDKKASYTALVELGPGRVASPFDFFHALIQVHGLHAEAWPALCRAVQGYAIPARFTPPGL